MMNPMASRTEAIEVVAWSYDKDKLIRWYKSQKVDLYTTHGKWAKHFAEGGPLEWYNPLLNEGGRIGSYGHGIVEKWVEEKNIKTMLHGVLQII